MTELNRTDPPREDESEFTAADLLVEAHGLEEGLPLLGAELDGDRKTGGNEEVADPGDFTGRETESPDTEMGGGDLTDGNGFAMQIVAVAGDGFETVTDAVTEVEDGAKTGFGFVLADHLGLDGAATGNDGRQDGGIPCEELGHGPFQTTEQGWIMDDPVLDDLTKTSPQFALGQGAEGVEIAQDQAGLMEGPHQVLPSLEVHADLATHRAVHLGKQGGGDLDEGDSPQVGGGNVDNQEIVFGQPGMLLKRGTISLQSESHPVEFKNIEILNLEGCMDPKALNYKSYYIQSKPEDCRYRR